MSSNYDDRESRFDSRFERDYDGDSRGGRGGGRGGGGRRMHRRKICRFCIEKTDLIDFKDVKLLQNYIPERGKIVPRRISGSCAPPAYAAERSSAPNSLYSQRSL